MTTVPSIVWWLLSSSVCLLIGWCSLSTWRVLNPERRLQQPQVPSTDLEAIPIQATDATRFSAWRLKPSGIPQAHLLFFHGYYADRYQVLGIAELMRQRGFASWVMELRGHGQRPGPCTLSVKESDDAHSLLRWIQSNANDQQRPVAVLGFSMGACVALRLALITDEVAAVITDSAFSRLYPVIRSSIRKRYHLPGFFSWLTWKSVCGVLAAYGGFLEPFAMAKQLRMPLLVIVPGADTVVDASDSRELYENWRGSKQRWDDASAGHVKLFEQNPLAYAERVTDFLTETFAS